jgi:DMSO/TMAO reductase YedYZ molybdopterin-dependent catalytic subunit
LSQPISRRRFLAVGGAIAALRGPLADLLHAQTPPLGGEFVRLVPLTNPGQADDPPLNRLLGTGLDARLFTDLSTLAPGTLITPNVRFYIRTAVSDAAQTARPWALSFGGQVRSPSQIGLETLENLAARMGIHLLECAGNSNPNNYGLMSAARWDGVPVLSLLDRLRSSSHNARVLIAGVDDEHHPSRTSVRGASWIFSRDDLGSTRAFLATRMNGVPLAPDHGAPLRLVVPGWYGCACIKWVNRIDLVPDDSPPTSQMREFAERTHQPHDVRLAREFTPPTIDVAAVPVRIEQWAVGGRPLYRIVGIVWGGSIATSALQIRFRTEDAWVNVTDCPRPTTTATWSLWSHNWRPETTGRYHIALRVNDPSIRTRRLDLFFYVRQVDISEV